MSSMLKKMSSALVLVCAAISANASVVGIAAPDTGNCFPLGCTGWGTQYQQVYSSGAFGGATSISSITFYNTAQDTEAYQLNGGTYQLYLSTTSKAVKGLSNTMSSNVGADELLVYSGALPGNSAGDAFGGHFDFLLSSVFSYDPSLGNLLLRVVSTDASPRGGIYLDMDTSGSVMSRMFGDGDAARTEWGLVTGFNEAAVTDVPEPMTLGLVAVGLLGIARARRKSAR